MTPDRLLPGRVPSLLAGLLALAVAVALLTGLPAGPAEAVDAEVRRLGGTDRFATAAAVSADAFEPGTDVAYVATGFDFPDALAAGPAAAAEGGPILLVTRTGIPEATRDELERLEPQRIVVLGGAGAIDGSVVEALEELTEGEVERLAGGTRYSTAAAVSAATFDPGVPVVFVASGMGFADALSGGAAAGSAGGPLLLVGRDQVPEATTRELQRLRPARVVVLGGTGVVSAAVAAQVEQDAGVPVERVFGGDRFATAVALSESAFAGGASTAFLATGLRFPDALAGGPLAGGLDAPVLLSRPDCVPHAVLDELERLAVDEVVLLGGAGALGVGVERLASCEREVSVLLDGLQHPWDVTFTPDGRTFLTERDRARALELTPEGAREVNRFPADTAGEGGLLGLATSPDYAEDGLLYAYYTSTSDNRVVAFQPGGSATPVLTGIPKATIHDGGRIEFGPDGMLYVATGDARDPDSAQDLGSLAGKILRVTPDGDVPEDNPYGSSPVWSYGHRNVQGLAWDADGQLYAAELGPQCDDEVNRIVAGGNYGWPDSCGQTRDGAIAPVIVRQPAEASWSGAAFLVDGAIGQWEGDLFAAGLRGQRLWRFRLADDGGSVTEAEELLSSRFGRLRHVQQAPDGSLWVLTTNGTDDKVIRIGPPRPGGS